MTDSCAPPQTDVEQNLLIVLTVSNVALLFLVGLLARRLEALNVKLTFFIKSSRMQSHNSLKTLAAPPPRVEPARDHAHVIRKTPSEQSIRSSLSADDYASLQCMLGDEDGVTM